VNGCWRAHKWAYFERKSSTNMMTNLLPDLGIPTMNSIEISVHIAGGIGRGWSVPRVLIVFPLLC